MNEQQWQIHKIFPKIQFFCLGLLLTSFSLFVFAQTSIAPCESVAHENCEKRLNAVAHKIQALKEHNLATKISLDSLQKQQAQRIALLEPEAITTLMLDQAQLKEALANANHDGANITVVEIQQLIDAIHYKISSLENELRNVTLAAGQSQAIKSQIQHVQQQLAYQRSLLDLEKQNLDEAKRAQELSKLQLNLAKQWHDEVESQYKIKLRIESQQKLLAEEAKLERQQREWTDTLTQLNYELNQTPDDSEAAQKSRERIQLEIIRAREYSNLIHVKIVLARLNSQLMLLHENIHQNMMLNELNNTLQQSNLLYDDTKRLQANIKSKLEILKRRIEIGKQRYDSKLISYQEFQKIQALVNDLLSAYESEYTATQEVLATITSDQNTLQQSLSKVLSRRQGLPGFELAAWQVFGAKLLQVPSLASQALEAIFNQLNRAFKKLDTSVVLMIIIMEFALLWVWFYIRNALLKVIGRIANKRTSVTGNMLFVILELIKRSLGILFIFIGFLTLVWLSGTSTVTLMPIIYLFWVWLVFRVAIQLARLSLLETVGTVSGHDVRLYRQLRYALIAGGGLTMVTVLAHILPVGLEVRELFNRLFMVFLAITGALLLRNWRVVPEMIEAFLRRKRPYLMRIVRLVSLLIPFTLLSTGIIGILGYVDLAWTISLYEAIFLLVLSGYVFARGLLNDFMEYLSVLAIRKLRSGWLWTQALLRPIDKVAHIALFLCTVYSLFYFYGWDHDSFVVQKLKWTLNFPLISLDTTAITIWAIIEFAITIAVMLWAARWTREFAFRWLYARTLDSGLRNSLAVLTQYTVVTIILIISLRVIGVELKALNYILTALAFGIGFGLRDLARNYVSGFILLLERPVRVGDLISVGENEGEVTHIGMRAITMITWDHMEVLVPNSEIFETTFTNWTRQDSIVRSVVVIKINRQDDPNFIQQIINQVLEESSNVVFDPPPQVFLKEVQDPLLEFELRYFIDLSRGRTRPEIRSDTLFAIWEAFKANGIRAPNPQQDIHIRTIAQTSDSEEVIVDVSK